MEAGVFAFVAFVAAFGCAFVVGRSAFLGFERAMAATRGAAYASQRARVQGAANGRGAVRIAILRARARDAVCRVSLYYVRNGVASFLPLCKRIVSTPAGQSFRDASRLATRKGVDTTPEGLASLFAASVLALAILLLVVFQSFVVVLCALVLCAVVLRVVLTRAIEKERAQLREQVPDALRCMEACMHAGLSLPQTFSEVAQQIDQPARSLFARVSRDLDLGYSMNEALEHFKQVAELPELSFVAMALDVQYACGGSATPVLRSAEESISRDLDLRRSLRVQTAQAKLSAQIVSVMPFALVFVISAVDPAFLHPFFSSAQGVVLLLMAIAMLGGGVLLVRRMLAVEI